MYIVICINRICFCKNTYKMKAMEIFFSLLHGWCQTEGSSFSDALID